MKKTFILLLMLLTATAYCQTWTLDNDTTGAFTKRLSSYYPYGTISTLIEQYSQQVDITLYSDSSYIVGFDDSFGEAFTWKAGVVLYLHFERNERPLDIWFKAASAGVVTINGVIKGY